MTARTDALLAAAADLDTAAGAVLDHWEHGDLAGAVSRLGAARERYLDALQTPQLDCPSCATVLDGAGYCTSPGCPREGKTGDQDPTLPPWARALKAGPPMA